MMYLSTLFVDSHLSTAGTAHALGKRKWRLSGDVGVGDQFVVDLQCNTIAYKEAGNGRHLFSRLLYWHVGGISRQVCCQCKGGIFTQPRVRLRSDISA